MEGFLEFLRKKCPGITFPNEITKDNINMTITSIIFEYSFLQLAIKFEYFEAVRHLIELGARFTSVCATQISSVEIASKLIDCGIDLTYCGFEYYITDISWTSLGYFVLDNGLNFSNDCIYYYLDGRVEKFKQYYDTQVLPRISSCRKALLALLWSCKHGSSHGKGPFGALRNMMIQMATQVWCMRGGEGCGPRGHLWRCEGSWLDQTLV